MAEIFNKAKLKGDVTTDTIEIQRANRNYFENLYATK